MIEYLINQNLLLKKENLQLKNKIKSNDFEKQIFDNNLLITSNNELNLIKTGIIDSNNKKLKLKLLYRASIDGDTSQIFHSKCDGYSHTISIFRTSDDKIFGGYTDIQWDNHSLEKKAKTFFCLVLII